MSIKKLNESDTKEFDSRFNDKYFPRVSTKGKKIYHPEGSKDTSFIYDDKNALLISIFKDPEEVEALGNKAPWRESDTVGLSRGDWKENPQYWVDMVYDQQQEESSYIMDGIVDEFTESDNDVDIDTDDLEINIDVDDDSDDSCDDSDILVETDPSEDEDLELNIQSDKPVCPNCGSEDCDGSCKDSEDIKESKNVNIKKESTSIDKLYHSKATDYINDIFDKYVPGTGKSNVVAGEIARAVSRIVYRYLNDGDKLGVGYGRETVNPAARYLLMNTSSNGIKDVITNRLWSEDPYHETVDDSEYENSLYRLIILVSKYLKDNPDLTKKENHTDMWNLRNPREDVDDDPDEDEDEDEYYDDYEEDEDEFDESVELNEDEDLDLDDSDSSYNFKVIDSKDVPDSDGFITDYTLYYLPDEKKYVTIFGDSDFYDPSNTEPDFETDSESEAREWFDSYEGFIDED